MALNIFAKKSLGQQLIDIILLGKENLVCHGQIDSSSLILTIFLTILQNDLSFGDNLRIR